MWGSSLDDARMVRANSRQLNQWHNSENTESTNLNRRQDPEDSERSSDDAYQRDGTWGERDAGGPSEVVAMEDYEALRRQLTNMSRTRSKEGEDDSRSLARTLSRTSTRARAAATRRSTRRSTTTRDEESQIGDVDVAPKDEDDFELDQFMREGHFEKRKENRSAKKVGVVYKNLTVKGVGSAATFIKTLPDAILGTFGPDLYHLVTRFIPVLRFGRGGELRTLINDFTGVVRDGR